MQPSIPTPRYLLKRNEDLHFHKKNCMCLYWLYSNYPKLETTPKFFDWQMNRQAVAHPNTRIVSTTKRKCQQTDPRCALLSKRSQSHSSRRYNGILGQAKLQGGSLPFPGLGRGRGWGCVGVMGLFYILIVVVIITWLQVFVKTHKTVHLNR